MTCNKWFEHPEVSRRFFHKLATWTPLEILAIVDACERAWDLLRSGAETDARQALRSVGLLH